jgi:hypothetical protein
VISPDLEEVCCSEFGGRRRGVPCSLGIKFSAMGGDYELHVKQKINRREGDIPEEVVDNTIFILKWGPPMMTTWLNIVGI